MFGARRRGFPFAGLLLFAAGFAVASIAGGAGSSIGFLVFLPLLALKLMLLFFIVGTFMRFAGGGFGRAGGWGGSSSERQEAGQRRPGGPCLLKLLSIVLKISSSVLHPAMTSAVSR